MKKLHVLLLLCLLPFAVKAQDCEAYFPMSDGTEFELTNYNPKGKMESKVVHTIISVEGSGANITVQAKNEVYDKKGNAAATTEYTAKCVDGSFEIDMMANFQSEQMAAWENMEMSVDGDPLIIPSGVEAGDVLPDASLTVSVASTGPIAMGMTVEVTERKIEAVESITTPAGTFECIKISQTTSSKVMGIKIIGKSIEWYSIGVGIVRSESYKKNGKMMGYSELTALKQ